MLLLATEHRDTISRFRGALLARGNAIAVLAMDAYWRALTESPQLIVFDLAMAAGLWESAIERTRMLAPASKILVVAEEFTETEEISLLRLGVGGCCAANVPHETLVRIIDMILDGGVWISNAVLPVLLRQLQSRAVAVVQTDTPVRNKLELLTPREREIANLVGNGASNKLIARQLDISDRTVKAHLGAIFQKLGTPDRLRLAVYLNNQADPVAAP
ncbi:MAG: response regulator transcription factor [Janthinobacterium lividum]